MSAPIANTITVKNSALEKLTAAIKQILEEKA